MFFFLFFYCPDFLKINVDKPENENRPAANKAEETADCALPGNSEKTSPLWEQSDPV